MYLFNDTAFLCSYFSFNEKTDPDSVLKAEGWLPVCYDKDTIDSYKQYFYSGFIEFSLGGGTGEHVRKYAKQIDRSITIDDKKITIKDLLIYVMPYGMALYSIHTEQESDDLGSFTLPLFKLRERRRWSGEELEEFRSLVILPIEEAASALGSQGEGIIENGNKLKVFQIVTADKKDDLPDDTETLIFELGTLGKVGGYSQQEADSPSKSYLERIIRNNQISFFNNWKGLALFDTFTIVGYDVKPWVRDTWTNDYFAMIYIHSLFCKFYLFRLNARFRSNPQNSDLLENEYHDFERLYTFHRISYNFLPGEIDKAIDNALEISEEKRLISGYISDYNKLRAEESSKRLNRILTFLTVVTVFSTIWDFACMVNALWPFQNFTGTAETGFRLVISLTLLMVILSIISILRKPGKNK